MKASLTPGAVGTAVTRNVLGANLEMISSTSRALSPNRLRNATFAGPPNPDNGLAPEWQAYPSPNAAGPNFALVPGAGMSGRDAQPIRNASAKSGVGICQTCVALRPDERLTLTLWARCQFGPASVEVSLRLPGPGTPLATAQIEVTEGYFAEYRVELHTSGAPPAAMLCLTMAGRGTIVLHRVDLRETCLIGRSVRDDIKGAIRGLGAPVLRFPGGCLSTAYHWALGTGPAELRPVLRDPVFKWGIDYSFGTDEYLELCAEFGMIPHIGVNVGTGTPREAAEWAAYVWNWYERRGMEPPAAYWQIGNEHWGDWEIGHMTGGAYARALRAYVPGIRAAYPKALTMALGPEKGASLEPGQDLPWRAAVLREAADLIDVLAIHHYHMPSAPGAKALLDSIRTCAAGMTAEVASAVADADAFGSRATVAITEWNMWLCANHQMGDEFVEPYGLAHTLFVPTVLNALARVGSRLEVANFYHVLNAMGLVVASALTVEETTLAAILRLYGRVLPGRLLECTADGDGASLLDTLWVRGDGADAACDSGVAGSEALFVVNLSGTDGVAVDVLADLTGCEATTFTGTDLDAPAQVTTTTAAHPGEPLAIQVPPMSVVVLSMERA